MKIIVVRETNPFVLSNANNNRFLSLAEGLLQNGASVDVLIINGFSSKYEKQLFPKGTVIDGIRYTYLSPYYIPNFIARKVINRFIFRNSYLLYKQILKQLSNTKFDYIWLEPGELTTIAGIKLQRNSNISRLFQERSEYSWIGFSSNNKNHSRYLNEFLPKLDSMALMTNTLLTYYKEYVGESTKMIHLPMTVDFARFQNSHNNNSLKKPYIAYCGSMDNAKDGVDVLVRSFIEIMNTFPDLHLYLAGPLMPRPDYLIQKSIIEETQADNRITYLGNLSREEMPAFLQNARILAMARPESKQAEGGFPTKLGEYLATGKPVCVTNVGEIFNYLHDNESAFIASPGSIKSFADALARALTSKNACKIGKQGQNVALKHFNKDIQAKTLYDFLLINK